MTRTVTAQQLRGMIEAGGELAIIDVREELPFSESHLLHARSLPLSRLELRLGELVPRRATPIVLVDDGEGLALRAAAKITHYRYGDVSVLAGGTAAWGKAGFTLFSGTNVPSKAFGEFIEHESGTPSIGAAELHALMESRADMVVLDSRPWDEYRRIAIPGGIDVPGAELVLRARDMAPDPADARRRQLRRPHAQHHRRAVAHRCRPAEQGRGIAQRHDGLDARRVPAGAWRGPQGARAVSRRAKLGERGGRARGIALWRPAHRRSGLGALARGCDAHDLSLRRARSGRVRGRASAGRGLGAGRAARPGDRPVCRHDGRAHRARRSARSARADDRRVVETHGLARRVRARRGRDA